MPDVEVGNGFKEVACKRAITITPDPVYTEHHSATPLNLPRNIPERAAQLLEIAAATIRERGASYNGNGVSREDYNLLSMDSTWQDILECFVRLYVSGEKDKAVDWVAYSALQAAFVEAGMPQSRFAPIFRKVIKGLR